MEVMIPSEKPSRIFHAVCAYWLTSSAGFNANAPGHTASSTPANTRPSATTCRPPPRALDITGTFYLINSPDTVFLFEISVGPDRSRPPSTVPWPYDGKTIHCD